MDWSESTPYNRRSAWRRNHVFCSTKCGDNLRQISVYEKMTISERKVAELLKEMGIRWSYEHPVFVWDDNNRPRVWAPDFYLKQLGIYIEVCGSEKFDYDYRKKIFNKNGYSVIFLHLYKDRLKWKNHLVRYLKLFIEEKNNKLFDLLEIEN